MQSCDNIVFDVDELRSLEAKARSVARWLTKRKAMMAYDVLHRSKVMITADVDVAAVSVSGADITMFFNYEFLTTTTLMELSFVVLHEALHVAFEHPKRIASMDAWKRKLFYYACEAVINDVIVKYYGIKAPEAAITGQRLVDRDCSQLSANEVLRIMLDDIPDIGDLQFTDSHDAWGAYTVTIGIPTDGDGQAESTMSVWGSDSDETVGEVRTHAPRDCYGRSPAGAALLIAPPAPPKKSLTHYVRDLIRDCQEYTVCWTRVNKKAIAAYPNVVLPTYPEDEHTRVLMAIDASASISTELIAEFLDVAEDPLPGCDHDIISFDTRWYHVKNRNVLGGGGTDINAVQTYIDSELGGEEEHPDIVFVFTDCQAPELNLSKSDRWVFLLTSDAETDIIPAQSKYEFFE